VATVMWLFVATLFLYSVAITLTWSTAVVRGWARHAWTSFVGRRGYLVIFGFVTLYAGIYAIVEARHERRAGRALFERSTFMTMVVSGNRGTFVAAMKTFGPVQTIAVPRDPELLAFWRWFEQEKPNEDPLHIWAFSFFPLCTAETCGNPDAQPKPRRIDLRQADLPGTLLINVDLHDADLYNADLQRADLPDADLRGANLIFARLNGADLSDADLRGADLRGAWLIGADLSYAKLRGADLGRPPRRESRQLFVPQSSPGNISRRTDLTSATLDYTRLQGVDLREVFGLTQAQLNAACVDDLTQLPNGLIRPAPCR
jgi:hypothetical protein